MKPTPPKILFATPDYSYFTRPVSHSLSYMGYQIQTFDYYKPTLLTRIVGIAGNLKLWPSSLAHSHIIRLINQSLLRQVSQFQPDYLLVIKGETLLPATIKAITHQGVITINWYSDWYDSWSWIIRHAPHYSVFVNMCRATQRRLKKIGLNTAYLPVASYLDGPPSKRKRYPITFVGKYTPERERYFQAIKDLGLKIWGYHHWQQSSLKHLAHGPVSVRKTRQIIRLSKITVNLLNSSPAGRPDQINTRTVETTSVGSFLLVKDSPILHQYFTPGKEVVTFTNPRELRQKAIYYLKHEKERARIARAGYQRAKSDHTFDTRLKDLFALVKQFQLE